MKHTERLIKNGQLLKPDTIISLPVARDCGLYPGILYPYLQRKQAEQTRYSDKHNVRRGIRWIPSLSAGDIVAEVPAFPNTQTVQRAAETLRAAGLILMETTGQFLERAHRTHRKRDIATWWHVSREFVMAKVPDSYFDVEQHQAFSALEAAGYGVAQALILAHWRRSEVGLQAHGHSYKRLSAVELEKVLPMDERTVRRHLKSMVKEDILVQHETQPKLYRLGGFAARNRPVEELAMAA